MSAGWSCNEWDQLEEVIVGEAQAPTAVCSKKFYDNEIHWPAHYSREDRAELYDNEVKVTVPAG